MKHTIFHKSRLVLTAVAAVGVATAALAAESDYLVRFTFKASGKMNCMQLSELAVYDANGTRLNANLTDAGIGIEPSELKAGEFSVSSDVCTGSNESWSKLFDGNTYTKLYASKNLDFSTGDQVALTMRFVSATAPASYDFRTANDVPDRSPTAWDVEVSVNGGAVWYGVDSRQGFGYPSSSHTWFGGKNDGDASDSPMSLDMGALSPLTIKPIPCQHLDGQPTCAPIPVVINRETQEELAGVAELFDIAYSDNDRIGLASGTLTGKMGAQFDGVELSFTFAIVPDRQFEYLMRITLKDGGSNGEVQFSELAVYDSEGERINLRMGEAGSSVSAGALQPGQYKVSRVVGFGQSSESWNALFDGDSGTKLCATKNATLDPLDPDTWLTLTMRFADVSRIPAFYDFCTAGDAFGRSPRTWIVEMSNDYGETWVEADAQTDFAYPNSPYTWFSQSGVSEQPFALRYEGTFPFVVEPIRKQPYCKKPVEPKLTVIDKETGLEVVEGKDYTVVYENNNAIGTGTAIVTSGGSYGEHSKAIAFEIVKKRGLAVIFR